MYFEVIPTKIFRTAATTLTYSSDLPLLPGHLVRIPLGRSEVTGIVLKAVKKPPFATKPITRLLYDTPLPAHLLKSILWLSDYYLAPLPQVASLVLPSGIEKKRRSLKNLSSDITDLDSPRCISLTTRSVQWNDIEGGQVIAGKIPLNPAQSKALSELQDTTGTHLLHGITGSGKTNIYLKLTADTLKKGHSIILLVPEIALTSQLVQIFCSTFTEKVTLIHSRQSESERHQIWSSLLASNQPEIIIGPRSALFAPLRNLGLIIIDEAHESSYFQENAPKYSTVRLASFIASYLKIPCLLGTATPLITDYYLATAKKSLVTLTQKAKSTAKVPDIHIVKLTNPADFTKNRYFSNRLLSSIRDNLENRHQTLIFHNRRGSAPLTICTNCGWQALCPTCYLPLTLHTNTYELTCHTCGFKTTLPHSCPSCHHPDIVHKGFGTKLLESELKKLFKDAKIARFDADNTKLESLDALYDDVKTGAFDIIIGTQTIAKGLDLPGLATVGVVQADSGLSLPDYASEERTFHLLTQVIGRVGRGHQDKAEVIIQTFQPDHPVITSAVHEDYATFYRYLLQKRRAGHLPPYFYLAKLAITMKTEATVIKKITALHHALSRAPGLSLENPTPAFHEHTNSGYTWQLILRSTSRKALLSAISHLDPKLLQDLHITLDPPSLL